MATTTIGIHGMTCMGCVASVKRVLSGVDGITSADVSLEKAQATITYDPAKAALPAIKAAVTDAGYDVS